MSYQEDWRQCRRLGGPSASAFPIPLPVIGEIVALYGLRASSCGRVEAIFPKTGLARVEWDLSPEMLLTQSARRLLIPMCRLVDLMPPLPHAVERSRFAARCF